MRPQREQSEFQERVISIDRISRVVKGGRRFRFRALVVIGDGKGKIGMGIAKGSDVSSAIAKAVTYAEKRMTTIPLHEHGTIPHEVNAKHSGGKVFLKPASPGTGVIAGGAIRDVLEVAGVTDILSKNLGSSNKINCCYATFAALDKLVALKKVAK